MRNVVVTFAVVSMLLTLAFVPMTLVTGQSSPYADVADVKDMGEDIDGDKLYEYLLINITLDVKQAGDFKVFGSLIFTSIRLVTNSTPIQHLGLGYRWIELRFNSTPIFKSQSDGQFIVEYDIRFDGSLAMNGSHLTMSYDHRKFDDPTNYPVTPAQYKPSISKDAANSRYVIKNEIITVWFYYKVPRFVWFYTKDTKDRTKFYCEFLALHGYVESGIGFFVPSGNTPYYSDLRGRTGAGQPVELGIIQNKSKLYGEFVSVSVAYNDVPVNEVSSEKTVSLANITITVTLAAGDRDMPVSDKSYQLTGGTDVKIDMATVLKPSLGVNGIALEQEIWSESNKSYRHDLAFKDAASTRVPRESQDSRALLFIPTQDPQSIDFVPKYTKTHTPEGRYSFISMASVNGANTSAPMTYSYMPEKKHLKLYQAFTTKALSITRFETDPIIGINEYTNPSEQQIIRPAPSEQPSVLITIMGWVTAVVLVILPLYVDIRRSQRKLRELEEEFGEDL